MTVTCDAGTRFNDSTSREHVTGKSFSCVNSELKSSSSVSAVDLECVCKCLFKRVVPKGLDHTLSVITISLYVCVCAQKWSQLVGLGLVPHWVQNDQ